MQYRILGFSGTRKGLAPQQKKTLQMLLEKEGKGTIFHHGCCEGADLEANEIARDLNFRIVEHPGHGEKDKPFSSTFYAGSFWRNIRVRQYIMGAWLAKPYLERNKDIVDCCQLLIACPKSDKEEPRSGTWATIRYAVRIRRNVIVIWPDGKFETVVTLPIKTNREVKSVSKKAMGK